MKKNLSVAIVLCLLLGAGIPAEELPKPLLQKGDVERFVNTFPALSRDLMKAGMTWEAKSGSMKFPEAMCASNQVLTVLKKHGWDEKFFAKSAAILQCYSQIKYGQSMNAAQSKFALNMRKIDENPSISPQMKAQLKAQMKQAMGVFNRHGQELKKQNNPADLLLVRPWISKLETVLETSEPDEGK